MLGYVNEVRIWNVARTQSDIRTYLNTSLPSPATQAGLQGYYIFNDLLNKQGNPAFNASLQGPAMINAVNPSCFFGVNSDIDFDFSYRQDICNPLSVQFTATGTSTINPHWIFGDNTTAAGTLNPSHLYAAEGTYTIKYSTTTPGCTDTVTKIIPVLTTRENVVLTPDTTICSGTTKQLRAVPALAYCWTPSTYLSDPAIQNPVTSTPGDITYFLTTETTGTNLVVNGNFSAGNTGFTSQYQYVTPNVTEGQYYISANANAWNSAMMNCPDHTGGGGNMMLVNGAAILNSRIWSQTITVTPNTNYAFTTWIQSLNSVNPANLKFSINNHTVGDNIVASATPCQWNRFYTTWNSGNSASATITIVNNNTVALGNDFALDDISFSQVFIKRDSVIITVDKPMVKTNDDIIVCPGTPVQLNTTGAQSYVWDASATLSSTIIPNPLATPVTPSEYIVTGTTTNGCVAKDTVNIDVYTRPAAITVTDDTQICPNATLQLTATGGASYTWIPDPTLNNPLSPTPVVSPTADTWYYVDVTDNNTCTWRDSVQVTIRPDPVFSIDAAPPVCIGNTRVLNASGGDSYNWQASPTLSSTVIHNPVASPTTTTMYTVTISEACGESATLSTTVVVNPLPTISINKSNDIDCSYGRAQLSASGAAFYTWTPAGTLSNPAIPNPVATPTTTTDYTVTGTDRNGCDNTSTVTVKVEAINEGKYLMANAFTPNNDGLNDCYGVALWGAIEDIDFSIYNRWGERVFHSTQPTACWNGIYKGIPQNSGVFVYMIKAKTFCSPTVFRKGTFVLIR